MLTAVFPVKEMGEFIFRFCFHGIGNFDINPVKRLVIMPAAPFLNLFGGDFKKKTQAGKRPAQIVGGTDGNSCHAAAALYIVQKRV